MKTAAPRCGSYHHLTGVIFFYCIGLFFAAVTCSTVVGSISVVSLFLAYMQLAAMWAVLGPGSYWLNCAWSLVACLSVGLVTLIGLAIGTGTESLPQMAELAGHGPAIWMLAQIPYWICRMFFGWQIVSIQSPGQRPVSITDLMTLTGLTAFSLAVLQLTYSLGVSFQNLEQGQMLEEFLMPVSISLVGSFVLVCLPAILLLFTRASSATRFYGFFLGMLVLTVIVFPVLAVFGSGARILTFAIWAFAGGFGIPLMVHRKQGFFVQPATVHSRQGR